MLNESKGLSLGMPAKGSDETGANFRLLLHNEKLLKNTELNLRSGLAESSARYDKA